MTDRNPNGEHWTLGTLRLYLEERIDVIKTALDSLDKRCDERFTAMKENVKDALAAADRATTKAETASDKRFEGVNEFRKSLDDNNRLQMPRLEAEALVKGLRERIEKLETLKDNNAGRAKGVTDSWAVIIAVAAVIGNMILTLFYISHWKTG